MKRYYNNYRINNLGGEILDRDIDKILIKKILKGDIDSFSTLVQNYQTQLYNLFMRMTYSKEDTEEILQDVFIKIYKNLYKYNPKWPFSAWLYKIAINTYKSNINKKKKYYEHINYETLSEDICTSYGNPELSYELKEGYKEIVKMFGCLKSEQKFALLLKHFKGFSYKEIGHIMGITDQAAKMKVQRAKNTLCERYYNFKERC